MNCPRNLKKPEDNGHKLPYQYMGFIDEFIARFITHLAEPLHNLGITPNMVTIFGIIIRLYSIYLFTHGKCYFAVILYFIGYVLDCLDGYMARKYDQMSKIGDVLDHLGDLTIIFILILFILQGLEKKRISLLVLYIFTVIILFLEMGYQEQYYSCLNSNPINDFLLHSEPFYTKKDLSKVPLLFRVLDCGASQVILCILMFFVCYDQTCML